MILLVLAPEVNRIKIGYSHHQDVLSHLKQLKDSSPVELRLIGCISGNQDIKEQLHELFAGDHIIGEWFHYSDALKEFTQAADIRDIPNPKPQRVPERLAYTVADFAQLTRIPKSSVYRLIASKQLKCPKIGRRWIISAEEVRRFLGQDGHIRTNE